MMMGLIRMGDSNLICGVSSRRDCMTKSEFKRLNTEYQATVYSATTPDGILLIRPGRRNHLLDNVLNAFRAKRWAFITAYNPGSIPMSDAINEAAHIELCRMLMRKGLVFFEGEGSSEGWPSEKSVLVLGIGRDKAKKLGRKFTQYAIVVGKKGDSAKVCWLTQPDS
jgi:hypothetical protein